MTVSGINASTPAYQPRIQSTFKQGAQDFKTLQSALKSGDLSGAQQAFASLQQDLQGPSQTTPSTAASTNQTNPIGNAFQALQSALQSGDLSGAQSAFASLQQNLQSVSGAHHARRHHHQSQSSGASTSPSQSTPSSTSSSTDASSRVRPLLDTQA